MVAQGEATGIFSYALLVNGPLVLLGFTCTYAFRGVRLLVMYYPHMRGRWKRPTKQRTAVKSMVLLFLLVEVVAWSAGLAFGVDR